MPWNDKSLCLRACRDRLHQTGKYAPTFKQSVSLIIEILGLQHSARGLSWCRRYAEKLRDQTPEPTAEQLELFGVLDDRLARKAESIRNRLEKKRAARPKKNPQPKPVTPPTGDQLPW
jgi:hypothetical protein